MPLRSCIDFRLPPALNALPLPVRMIALTPRSSPRTRSVSIISSQSACVPIAFMLSGLLIVRIAILPRRSTLRNSPIVQIILFSFEKLLHGWRDMQGFALYPFHPPGDSSALRTGLRRWLAEHQPQDDAVRRANCWASFDPGFSRALGAAGYIGMTLPARYGG